jgi:branched-chain amino acid transport system substrate-binding protein
VTVIQEALRLRQDKGLSQSECDRSIEHLTNTVLAGVLPPAPGCRAMVYRLFGIPNQEDKGSLAFIKGFWQMNRKLLSLILGLVAITGFLWLTRGNSPELIKVGLVASKTGGSALAGESIQRGLEIAIDEVNAAGGIKGKKLRLEVRDDEGNPSKGIAAVRQLIESEKVVAVFGGLHSPVSLAMMPVFQELQTPYIGTWAAATGITENDQKPNFMFRVSARDDFVDKFLVDHATNKIGATKPGIILENTPWGESNQVGLTKSLSERNIAPAGIERFNWGDTDMSPPLLRLRENGADCLIMIANAPEGAQVVRSLKKIQWEVPVVSHWGISGGRFSELAGEGADKVQFVQTYSFFGDQSVTGRRVIEAMKKKYGLSGPEDIASPVGTANAYDALHLLATALSQAQKPGGPELRNALENIKRYEGLIKTYEPPFSPTNHDALSSKDYILVSWKDGKIVPIKN